MAKNPDERIQTGREIVREVMRLRDTLVAEAANGGSTLATAGDSGLVRTPVVQMGPGGTTAFDATLTQSLPQPAAGPWWPWLAALSVMVLWPKASVLQAQPGSGRRASRHAAGASRRRQRHGRHDNGQR